MINQLRNQRLIWARNTHRDARRQNKSTDCKMRLPNFARLDLALQALGTVEVANPVPEEHLLKPKTRTRSEETSNVIFVWKAEVCYNMLQQC